MSTFNVSFTRMASGAVVVSFGANPRFVVPASASADFEVYGYLVPGLDAPAAIGIVEDLFEVRTGPVVSIPAPAGAGTDSAATVAAKVWRALAVRVDALDF